MAQTAPELATIIEQFRQNLEQAGIRCQQIFLYGSQRWGTATEGSDIDLIVISPDWAAYSWRERLELMGVIAARLLEPIQARGWTPQEVSTRQIGPYWGEILEKEVLPV